MVGGVPDFHGRVWDTRASDSDENAFGDFYRAAWLTIPLRIDIIGGFRGRDEYFLGGFREFFPRTPQPSKFFWHDSMMKLTCCVKFGGEIRSSSPGFNGY